MIQKVKDFVLCSLFRQLAFLFVFFVLFLSGVETFFEFYRGKAERKQGVERAGKQLIFDLSLMAGKKVHFQEFYDLWETFREMRVQAFGFFVADKSFTINEIVVLTLDNDVLVHTDSQKHPLFKSYSGLLPVTSRDFDTKEKIYLVWDKDRHYVRFYKGVFFDGNLIAVVLLELNTDFLAGIEMSQIKTFCLFSFLFMFPGLGVALVFSRWLLTPLLFAIKKAPEIGTGALHLDRLTSPTG